MLLVVIFANTKNDAKNLEKWLIWKYTQQGPSNEYKHDKVYICFSKIFASFMIALWTKVASALYIQVFF